MQNELLHYTLTNPRDTKTLLKKNSPNAEK